MHTTHCFHNNDNWSLIKENFCKTCNNHTSKLESSLKKYHSRDFIETKMTFQKPKESSLHSSKFSNKSPIRKRSLNNETTFKNRNCQLAVAEGNRIKSSNRNDVDQTTDSKAFNEMYEYIKSDTHTLDTHKYSQIASFYAGRSIFITGASGFVGKVSSRCEKVLCTKTCYKIRSEKKESGKPAGH